MIYYPKELEAKNYPVIVIGTEKNSWNAFGTKIGLRYMHKNAKIDLKKKIVYI